MSVFQTACILLCAIGLIIGLFCGFLFPWWVILIPIILIGGWAGYGLYLTAFCYHNRYETERLACFTACLIGAIPLGYVLGVIRWSL